MQWKLSELLLRMRLPSLNQNLLQKGRRYTFAACLSSTTSEREVLLLSQRYRIKGETAGVNIVPKRQSESTEDYLEAIYVLSGMCGENIRSSELAQYMSLSRASVCRAVRVLGSEGLLVMEDDFSIRLTEAGQSEAKQVYDRHRFFEEQLIRAGVDAAIAGEEACRLEHAISHDSFQKLRACWMRDLEKLGGEL